MGWNEKLSQTVEQRSKEEANDYRYFPDPDLPVMHFTPEYLEDLRGRLPELPDAKRIRFKQEYGLDESVIENLIAWKELNYYFEDVVSELDAWLIAEGPFVRSDLKPTTIERNIMIKSAANWCLQDFAALLNAKNMSPEDSHITPENFAELLKLIQQAEISQSAAKQVFKVMFEKGGEPHSIVHDLGLTQVSDESAIAAAIDKVIAGNEKAVNDFKAGNEKSFGFLVGMVMKEMKGQGNPQVVNELLRKSLS